MKRSLQPFGDANVQLRLITERDLDTTLAWRNRDSARMWFKTNRTISPEQHWAWFERYLQRDDDFLFIVEANGQAVGQAAVYGIDREKHIAEVGRFLIAPEAAGRGYMSHACDELLRCCAETLGLRSVFLEVREENQRAIRLYIRNGFVSEGTAGGFLRMTRNLAGDLARSTSTVNA
ncbi:MAG TPA: GNAT family N-acetyltransferase [Bryobacteraceae bacterium]|jgi:RimJ/RimL family protein N-acetyltransferase